MLGFPILYFKGMRPMMFRLSGFYCRLIPAEVPSNPFIPPAGYAATICGLPAKPLTQARGFATVVYNRGRNNQYGMISHRVHAHYHYRIRSRKTIPDHPCYGFGGPNSIIVVYMDPLGIPYYFRLRILHS